jgi:hypothetical protein
MNVKPGVTCSYECALRDLGTISLFNRTSSNDGLPKYEALHKRLSSRSRIHG